MNGAIFGVFGAFSLAETSAMGKILRYRGPCGETRSVAPKVMLGWRGGQRAEEGNVAAVPVVCACRLLNRKELTALEGVAAHAGMADAELLAALYAAHGAKGFRYINGQFAVAIYDASADALVLAVDSWSTRPLYFARCAGGYAFATEYKALLALEGVRGEPNRAAIAHLQATKYLPTGEGLFTDIHPLAPGGWVRLQQNEWSAGTYDPVRLEPRVERSEIDVAHELQNAVLAACERLVQGFDEVGVSLSGGLDSTLTVGALRAVAPDKPIYTYTASFRADDPALGLARQTAEYFRTHHREIVIPIHYLPRLMPQLVWVMEDPVAREEMLVYLVLAQAAAEDVQFMLHGHLSDMLFAGMPRHMLVRLAAGTPVFRKAVLELYDYSQTGAVPGTLLGKALVRSYYRRPRTPPPRVLGSEPGSEGGPLHLAREQPLNSLLLESLRHPTEIGCVERLHARWQVGYGSLFHDLDVARCAFRIPDSLKIHGLCRKYILRKAAAGILPPALVNRPKDMIRMPRKDALYSVLEEMGKELLGSGTVERRGLFDPADVRRLLGMDPSARVADDRFYHLWTLLMTETWFRTFVDHRGAEPIALAHPLAVGRRPRAAAFADRSAWAAQPVADAHAAAVGLEAGAPPTEIGRTGHA